MTNFIFTGRSGKSYNIRASNVLQARRLLSPQVKEDFFQPGESPAIYDAMMQEKQNRRLKMGLPASLSQDKNGNWKPTPTHKRWQEELLYDKFKQSLRTGRR